MNWVHRSWGSSELVEESSHRRPTRSGKAEPWSLGGSRFSRAGLRGETRWDGQWAYRALVKAQSVHSVQWEDCVPQARYAFSVRIGWLDYVCLERKKLILGRESWGLSSLGWAGMGETICREIRGALGHSRPGWVMEPTLCSPEGTWRGGGSGKSANGSEDKSCKMGGRSWVKLSFVRGFSASDLLGFGVGWFSLCVGTVLWSVGDLTASQASPITKNVPGYCQMSPGGHSSHLPTCWKPLPSSLDTGV